MLFRSQRISVEQFNVIMEKGRVLHSSIFLVRMMEKQDISCFSAVAPKKVAKTAVLRNKIRRKTYSAIRPLYNKLPKGTQAIFFAKVTFLKATQKEIENDIQAFFVKAGLIR